MSYRVIHAYKHNNNENGNDNWLQTSLHIYALCTENCFFPFLDFNISYNQYPIESVGR